MEFFTKLTNNRICDEILSAKKTVVIAAPGIDKAIAKALINAQQSLPAGAVQVVLDVSATTSRLGYGEFEAIEMLQSTGLEIKQQSGLRLGVLLCDGRGWSFVSAPCLVEAEAHEQDNVCNAIVLTEIQVIALRAELPAATTSIAQTTPDKFHSPIQKSIIGAEPVKTETIQQVKKALKLAPVQAFDLARQSQVYSSLVQFVELKLEGVNISARKVSLPKNLSLITTNDEEIKKRVSTTLKLLEKIDIPQKVTDIENRIKELRESFLIPAGSLGRVIIKNKRQDFEKILSVIKRDLIICRNETKKIIETGLERTKKALILDLSRAVMKNPPLQFLGKYEHKPTDAELYVISELDKVLPSAEKIVGEMNISCIYKDVTYEILKNEKFVDRLNKLIPKSTLDGALLYEHTAAAARDNN